MADKKTTRTRRLELRSQTLRVLGHDDLQQVMGGGRIDVREKEQRVPTRRCMDW